MSNQINQINAAPFGYVRPATGTVMLGDSHQHLNVAIPQTINYPSLIAHSMPLQSQSTSPSLPLQSVLNSVQYRVMSPWRLLRPSNKVKASPNDEHNITNNVSINVNHQNERNSSRIIRAAVIALIFLILFVIIVTTVVVAKSKLKKDNSENLIDRTVVYTVQEVVVCSNTRCGCIYQPCMNGGKCNSVAYNSFTCSCPTFYSGSNCQKCKLLYFFKF